MNCVKEVYIFLRITENGRFSSKFREHSLESRGILLKLFDAPSEKSFVQFFFQTLDQHRWAGTRVVIFPLLLVGLSRQLISSFRHRRYMWPYSGKYTAEDAESTCSRFSKNCVKFLFIKTFLFLQPVKVATKPAYTLGYGYAGCCNEHLSCLLCFAGHRSHQWWIFKGGRKSVK